MNRKIIAAAVAAAMLVSAVGCSDTEAEQQEETTTVATTEATTEATSEATTESTTEVTQTTAIAIPDFDINNVPTFEVTSENLNDGVWDDIISNTAAGENVSPQLSWEAVDGASTYVVYMIDTSAGLWMHMKASDITETTLDAGALGSDKYIGPYPPSGTHDYVVYVVALREAPERVRGAFDSSNISLTNVFSPLDVNAEGQTGNVIACGTLTGTYSAEG